MDNDGSTMIYPIYELCDSFLDLNHPILLGTFQMVTGLELLLTSQRG